MDKYKPLKPAGRNIKKIALIGLISIVLMGAIGYGTVTLLRQINAPILSDNTKITPPAATPAATPEKALDIANGAYESAVKKAEAGDQKAALVDYKIAFDNYTIAKNTTRAEDMQFAIKATEAVLAVKENPIKPGTGKTAAKEQ